MIRNSRLILISRGISTYTYDVMGNVLTLKNALNQITTYSYDAKGNLLSESNALGESTGNTYDAMGNGLSMTDARAASTAYTYDIRGKLVSLTDAAGGIATMAYDADGRLTKQTDAAGKVRSFTYNATGMLASFTDGAGNSIGINSTASLLPTSISFPTFTRSLAYDKRNRVITSTDTIGVGVNRIEKVAYDSAGNRIATTNSAGRTTRYAYDGLNRLTTVTDPAAGVTTYSYDAFDQLVSVSDANGNAAFRYEYDAAGRMIKELRPMGQFATYTYDGEDRLTGFTDALNNAASYTYDAAGRVTGISYPAANGMSAKSVSFSYDANGNITGYSDAVTTGTYTYDAVNRKLTDTVNYGLFSLSSSYSYFKNGRKSSFTGPDGNKIDYSYDAADLLQTVAIPGQGSIVYNSYNWLAPTKVTLPGGSTKNYVYDGILRPTNIHMKDPAANTLMNYAYSYDTAGNITAKNTEHGNYGYGYDSLDRLTSAIYPASQSALTNEDFGYDKVGNRITHNGNTVNPWSYNANNELLSRPNVTYAYDANGSQTKKTESGAATDYIYNGENRLAQVKQGVNLVAEYGYDPFGRRLFKIVGGIPVYFYYADEGLVAEADNTGNVLVNYGYQPGGIWGTDPLYMGVNGAYHFYLNDHLGTPQQLAAKNGAQSWAAISEVFGKTTVLTSPVTNNLHFPGQYYDISTRTNYNWNRYYDSEVGRYIGSDPIGLEGGINPFIYVYGNPIIFYDPFGLYCYSRAKINAIAGAVGGGVSGALSGFAAGGNPYVIGLGFVRGAIYGGAIGYLGTSSEGESMLAGGANAMVSNTDPSRGKAGIGADMVGGLIGGGLSYKLQQAGMEDSAAGLVGGAAGGFAGGALAAFLSFEKNIGKHGIPGGIFGFSGGAVTGVIAESLRAGNNCSGCVK